jgi:hypothetical protein
MASPTAFPEEKKETTYNYADGVDSDGEVTSFTELIAEGEILAQNS